MVRSPKVIKEGEQLELDLQTQLWLGTAPSRTEKNLYAVQFNKMKKRMYCNLNRDTHIFQRFKLILE
jgi:hypothetical protein